MSSRFGKRRKRLQRAGRLEALPYCRGNVRVRATGCQYFFRFDFGYQSAGLAENQNSFGQFCSLRHRMRDEDCGFLLLADQVQQVASQRGGRDFVQRRERLIGQQ
jgi:hypothetical protein